jgi:thioredoxin 1
MDEKVIEVQDKDFDKDVLQSDTPVVVDFWAPWCGPCKAVGPMIEKMAETHRGKAQFVKINIDDNAETAQKYAIKSVPTIMFFKDGQVVDKHIGMVTAAKLEESLSNLIAGRPAASPFIVQ